MNKAPEAVKAPCPSCKGICKPLHRIVQSKASVEGKNSLPAVRELLQRLCSRSYDMTFQGVEWESLIDEALQELKPFLKTGSEGRE